MTEKIHVLYVDDEIVLLNLGKLFLERYGDYLVIPAQGVEEAIDQLKHNTFDIIISDYQMPVMDGIEFLKHLKAGGDTTPFILFTGKGREEVIIDAFDNGADFYLQKGGEPKSQFAELSKKIQSAVSRRRAEIDLLKKNEEIHAAYEEIAATEEELRSNLEEIVRQEHDLRNSKRELSDIINFLPDATFVINLKGIVVAWNRAMEEMTGIPPEQMIGRGNYEYALPFYHERRKIMVDLILNDDPKTAQKYPDITRKGRYLFSEIFIPHFNEGRGSFLWFTASPLYDSEGNLKGAIESIRDITEWKNTKEELEESEEKYRNVVEDQTEFICRFRPDGTHIFVNDAYCRYFDKEREEIIGKRFKPRLHPGDREIVSRQMASLTRECPTINIDQRIIMSDGSVRWQRWNDRAIFDKNGILKEYQSVGRDITEQKEMEDALTSANKNLKLLSSITRHDIRNQLTSLMGNLGMLEDMQIALSQKVYLQNIQAAAQRISDMIQFTKEYECIGAHAPIWQKCHSLVDTAAEHAPLGHITVINELPLNAEVYADPLIVKVLYNLMDNATRYGGKITTIRFFALKHEDSHVLVCEDDGIGLPEDEKERIFEREFGKNSGIGLYLSREILSITGLSIRECGVYGEGARFEIEVPEGSWQDCL